MPCRREQRPAGRRHCGLPAPLLKLCCRLNHAPLRPTAPHVPLPTAGRHSARTAAVGLWRGGRSPLHLPVALRTPRPRSHLPAIAPHLLLPIAGHPLYHTAVVWSRPSGLSLLEVPLAFGALRPRSQIPAIAPHLLLPTAGHRFSHTAVIGSRSSGRSLLEVLFLPLVLLPWPCAPLALSRRHTILTCSRPACFTRRLIEGGSRRGRSFAAVT